jgi:hypothetical protein
MSEIKGGSWNVVVDDEGKAQAAMRYIDADIQLGSKSKLNSI